MSWLTPHRLYSTGFTLLIAPYLVLDSLPSAFVTVSPSTRTSLLIITTLLGIGSFGLGMQIGGGRTLWSWVRSTLLTPRLRRRRRGLFDTDRHIMGAMRSMDDDSGASFFPHADPLHVPPFHEHRMGRMDADGQAGWWLEVPAADAGQLQVKLQTTPPAPLYLHVAVNGAWIDAAGPAPVLVHELELAAGQVWMRASLAQPDGSTPLVELWLHPAPGAGSGEGAAHVRAA